MNSVFTLKDVSVIKGGKKTLDSVTWTIQAQCVSIILGPTGSGKTTLLRLLNRLEDATSGEIYYDSRLITEVDVGKLRREVGMVFQRSYLFEGSVYQNLLFRRDLGISDDDVHRVASLVGLDRSLLSQDATSLSEGQAQKVSIARAVILKPKVLLMDEPTSALDPTSTRQIENLVKDLVRTLGLTVIFVTHDVQQARRIGDRGILIINGRKVEEGTLRDMLDNPRDDRTARFIRGELK